MVLHGLPSNDRRVKIRDLLLAVLVAVLWGFNFVVIDTGLRHIPPLMFGALRFTAVAVPAVFFVGKPQVPRRWIIATGLTLGAAQFALLFAGMAAGMPAGLSGIVVQGQVVFTTVFGVVLLRERPGPLRLVGVAVSAVGLVVVGSALGPNRPAGAFVLVVAAGAAWGLGNIAIGKAAAPDMPRFMAWMGVVAAPPLAVGSLLVEGPHADLTALRGMSLTSAGAVGYVAWLSTLVGYGAWGTLIRRHGATTIAPFSMLVPVVALISTAAVLGERITGADLIGGVLVIGGVLLGTLAQRTPGTATSGERSPDAASRDGRAGQNAEYASFARVKP